MIRSYTRFLGWLLAGMLMFTPIAAQQISVSPDSFVVSVGAGDSTSQTLTLTNSGGSPLNWKISVKRYPTGAMASVSSKSSARTTGQNKTKASDLGVHTPAIKSISTVFQTPSVAGAPRILILAEDDTFTSGYTETELVSTGLFGYEDIDLVADPIGLTLDDLLPYDGVLVWTNSTFSDPVTVGDVLKQYVDAGGGVVMCTYGYSNNWAMQGQILNANYSPFLPATQQSVGGSIDMGSLTDPNHPIFEGIVADPTYWWNSNYSNPPLNTGGILLASDYQGNRVVAQNTNGSVVGIVLYPGYLYDILVNAEAKRMMANAMYFVSSPGWVSAIPDTGTVEPSSNQNVTISFSARLLAPGTYDALLEIQSNDVDPDDTIKIVPIHLTVLPPEITLAPTSFDITVAAGDSNTTILTIGNTGVGYLNWSAYVVYPDVAKAGGQWYPSVELNPMDGTVDPISGSVQVEIKTYAYAFSSGVYNYSIRVLSNDAETPQVDLPFTITVLPPDIGASPSSFNVSLASGDSTTRTLTIDNSGSGILEWDLSISSGATATKVGATAEGMRSRAVNPSDKGLSILTGQSSTSTWSRETSVRVFYSPIFKEGTGLDVALVAADYQTYAEDVSGKLFAAGNFNTITWIAANSVTPTLLDLQTYQAVMVWSDYSFYDATQLGNNLADYVDGGGGVVTAVFAGYPPSNDILGRFNTDNYWVIDPGSYTTGLVTLGTVYQPGHPLMQGVNSFNGGSGSYRYASSVVEGAQRIADWSDGNPLIAERLVNGFNRVDLGMFPPSSTIGGSSYWDATTDGAAIMANALLYVAGQGFFLSATPDNGVLWNGENQDVTLKFNATGLDPGSYQATLSISSNDPDESNVIVPVNMAVLQPDPPILTTVPDSILITLDPGDSLTQILTLGNVGTGDLIWSAYITNGQIGPYGELSIYGDTIAATNTQDVSVKVWANTLPGVYRYAIVIQSNDFTQPDHEVPLVITVNPPIISVTPGTFAVTVAPGDSTTRTMTISNIGAGSLNWNVSVIPAATATVHFDKPAVRKNARTNQGKSIKSGLSGDYRMAPGDFVPKADSPVELTCVTVDPTTNLIYAQQNDGYGFYSYDPETDQWTTLTSCPNYSGNNGGATYLDGKIYTSYTGGGKAARGGNSMAVYDITGDSWTTIPNDVYTGNIETFNGYIYLIDEVVFVRYDPINLTLDTLTHPGIYPYNSDNSWGGLRYFNGYLYHLPGDGDSAFAKYSISDDEWTFLENAPDGAVLGTAIDPTAAKFYASGSYGDSNFYEFDLVSETWSVQRQPYVEFNDGGMAYVSLVDHHGIYFVEGEDGLGFVFYETVPRQTWLTVQPASGTVTAGNTQDATVKFRPDTLATGEYLATLRISSNDPGQPIFTIPVQMTVNSDVTPPTVSLSFFQDKYVTSYLDLVAVMNEGLSSLPTGYVTKPSGYTPALSIDTVDAASYVYYAHFKMDTAGAYNFTVNTIDSAGNNGTASRSLSAALAKAGLPTGLVSTDEVASMALPEHTLREDAYLTVYQSAPIQGQSITPLSDAYVFGPSGIRLEKAVSITFDYSKLVTDGLEERHFVVYRQNGETLELIGTSINPDRRTATVQVNELGAYQLFYNAAVTSEINNGIPKSFALGQNFPNPFNPTTMVRYDLPAKSQVRLSIYNILGQEVRTLVNDEKAAGSYQVIWDGRNESGKSVASGIYIYRITADKFVSTRKMLLIK